MKDSPHCRLLSLLLAPITSSHFYLHAASQQYTSKLINFHIYINILTNAKRVWCVHWFDWQTGLHTGMSEVEGMKANQSKESTLPQRKYCLGLTSLTNNRKVRNKYIVWLEAGCWQVDCYSINVHSDYTRYTASNFKVRTEDWKYSGNVIFRINFTDMYNARGLSENEIY